MPGRIAFVPPRYGQDVVGGAETVVREAAKGLAARGWDVEILTTCVLDHHTWANHYPAGATEEDGLTIRRFGTIAHHSPVAQRAQIDIMDGRMPPLDDQWTWLNARFTVPGLFDYLLRHGAEYQAVVFAPYMFWTTVACLGLVRDRAVVIPCLHDETYARLDIMRPVIASPARAWFLSEPEHELAHSLGPVAPLHTVTGAGIDPPSAYDPDGFLKRHGLTRPFILYAGRREPDKGWDWLVEAYQTARRSGAPDVDLVTIGAGQTDIPPLLAERIIDLGFLADDDRNDAFAAASAYVQPSLMESFSRTVMEAWLAGTPVLARHGSRVVESHLELSGGGITFADGTELARSLHSLLEIEGQAAAMADRGRRYVAEHFQWPVVLDRMEADLAELVAAP